MRAAPADLRNAVVRIEQIEHDPPVGLEALVAQRPDRLGIARRDPLRHRRARDLLEPEIGVVGVGLVHAIHHCRPSLRAKRSNLPSLAHARLAEIASAFAVRASAHRSSPSAPRNDGTERLSLRAKRSNLPSLAHARPAEIASARVACLAMTAHPGAPHAPRSSGHNMSNDGVSPSVCSAAKILPAVSLLTAWAAQSMNFSSICAGVSGNCRVPLA